MYAGTPPPNNEIKSLKAPQVTVAGGQGGTAWAPCPAFWVYHAADSPGGLAKTQIFEILSR